MTSSFERTHEDLKGLSMWSTLVIATSLGLIVFSRGATFDVVVTMPITWALVCFFLHERRVSPNAHGLLLFGFYLAIGLALLAKGLVGLVVPFGVIALYYLLARQKPSRESLLSLLWGMPVALLVAALWYGPVISRHGWAFINEFFVQHHFARYVSNKYHHHQRFYFYVPILLMLAAPWSAIFVDSIVRLPRYWKRADTNSYRRLMLFAASWVIFPLLFFSLSGSKLPAYILPVLPAAAIMSGNRIRQLASKSDMSWSMIATGIIAILLGVGGLYYAVASETLSTSRAAIITAPLFIAGLITVLLRRDITTAVLSVAFGTALSLFAVVSLGAFQIAQQESVRDLITAADQQGLSSAPLFIRRGSDRTAEYYASGRVVYGADGEPQRLEDSTEIMGEAKRRGETILVLMPVEHLEEYRQSPQVQVIADNRNLALIAVKPK